MYENGEKQVLSHTFWQIIRQKTPFFAQKYLTRYTHETFFEEFTNFEAHYLSHCRVKPLQSFGSHIRPQPHRLGLKRSWRIPDFVVGPEYHNIEQLKYSYPEDVVARGTHCIG
jgi:hypothetical protein